MDLFWERANKAQRIRNDDTFSIRLQGDFNGFRVWQTEAAQFNPGFALFALVDGNLYGSFGSDDFVGCGSGTVRSCCPAGIDFPLPGDG